MATQVCDRGGIAVLAGGDSAEREVSLESGRMVARALRGAGHRVRLIDPANVPLAEVPWRRYRACLLALHGGAGEDGRVQAELERLGVPYTGSGPAACRLAMSKSASKERFWQAGVPTPDAVLAHASDPLEQLACKFTPLGFPLVIKPDGQGSSLGVSLVRHPDELVSAVFQCQRYEPYILAERYVAGREFTVGVIDREPLPVIEIVHDREFFDYDAKYELPSTRYRLDQHLPRRLTERITAAAVAATAALETAGACRVDLRLDDDLQPWVLEVNTTPGMTDHSLLPMAARAAGLSLAELCEHMIHTALATEMAA
ncbi:MAG: D-alanine--D-alanine ligase [Planctomycetaceae bacterium]|nr:D-alanine--D-alanine ligase [Planctomycetaceae bacterium]